MSITPDDALSILPQGLRKDLLDAFNQIVRNYRERRWEPAELNGGKLCEAVYTVVRGRVDRTYAARSSKPRDLLQACRDMERESWPERSVKIQVPRMITALYEIRNNRGVGHAGGDVDPNYMDATAVLYMSKWLLAEIIRLLHSSSTDEATHLVDALVEREVALVWSFGDTKRVLKPELTWKQKMLLLLVSEPGEVKEADLIRWIEHPNPAVFRRAVLRPAHKTKLIEHDPKAGLIKLLPPGVDQAEKLL
jgi:hypothetical protein